MRPKLRFYEVTGRSPRGMDAAMRNAMRAVERALAQDGGWTLVRIDSQEFGGYFYNRKTDDYHLSCWMVQYPRTPGHSRKGAPVK